MVNFFCSYRNCFGIPSVKKISLPVHLLLSLCVLYILFQFGPRLCYIKETKIAELLCSHSVVSNSLQSHGLQHARFPCSSLSPGICSNSRQLSQWCHPSILPSVSPFSSCPQSFLTSGSFPMSQLFASGGQSIGVLKFQLQQLKIAK